MAGSAARRSSIGTGPDRKPPGDLRVGDLILLDGAPFELLSEPFLGMRGTSVFDAPQLFWRARVRPAGGAEHASGYATWAEDEDVTVCRRA